MGGTFSTSSSTSFGNTTKTSKYVNGKTNIINSTSNGENTNIVQEYNVNNIIPNFNEKYWEYLKQTKNREIALKNTLNTTLKPSSTESNKTCFYNIGLNEMLIQHQALLSRKNTKIDENTTSTNEKFSTFHHKTVSPGMAVCISNKKPENVRIIFNDENVDIEKTSNYIIDELN